MANKTIDMQKIQSVLLLSQSGCSLRAIAKQTGIHRSVIKHYLERIEKAGLTTVQALALKPEQRKEIIYAAAEAAPKDERQRQFDIFSEYAFEELNKKHVTLQLLHNEYRARHPDGLSYSQFCDLLARQRKAKDIVMVQHYNPGDLMQIDFTGNKLYWFDMETGEQHSAEVLVITLGYSGLTYVRALRNQKQDELISCLNAALLFFGGVPLQMLLDNFKAGVIKADRYEPGFNKLLMLFCNHYGIVPDAARVRKPRDKAQVESHVRVVYERIFAPLRNSTFTSVEQINQAIMPLLEEHNKRPYRGSKKGRVDFFNEQERAALKPLPDTIFINKHYCKGTIGRNYHIWIGEDEHHYSVPFSYVGQHYEVVYDIDSVEVYCQLQRIAFHPRSHRIGRYTTLAAHMPDNHLKVQQGRDADYLLERALQIGPSTGLFIERLLKRGPHCQANFKSCQGLLSLSGKYSRERLEAAVTRALTYQNISFKAVQSILELNLDFITIEKQTAIPFNENIRGAGSYQL